ncbi:MAG: hypothetical protein A2Z32_04165 [Chloroflexi bacterium RBG_16_69_14]|nr:MAG: hypothetical protein A2Z32_04165 [Chloroflexi bacterium RBG_16_69_14]
MTRTSHSHFASLIVVGLLVAGCASAASPSPSTTPSPTLPEASTSASAPPPSPPGSAVDPTASPSRPPSTASTAIPVRGSALAVGQQILMAPGPGGTLFISIPRPGGPVLALLDSGGRPRPGWPIVLKDATACDVLLAVVDGSVRIICNETDLPQPDNDPADVRAFAFDAGGRLLPGWPVQLEPAWPRRCTAIMIDDELIILDGRVAPDPQAWLTTIAADGKSRVGTPTPGVEIWCGDTWAIGPDGVAYGSKHVLGDSASAPKSSEVLDVSLAGAGDRVVIDGIASRPAFYAAGGVVLTVSSFPRPTSRVVVFDDGVGASRSSAELPLETAVVAYSDTDECGQPRPRPPLVAEQGTTFVFSAIDSAIFALDDPSLAVMDGWPFKPGTPLVGPYYADPRSEISCPSLAIPAVGPDSTLYLPLQARNTNVGGNLVAVGPEGRVRSGWPVELKRPGSEFWSVVVGPDGTVYGLAIEPETSSSSSATILAIAPDSTVRWTTTIVEP